MGKEKIRVIATINLTFEPNRESDPYCAEIRIYLPADEGGNLIEELVEPEVCVMGEELNYGWGILVSSNSDEEDEDIPDVGRNMRKNWYRFASNSAEGALSSALKTLWIALGTLRAVAEANRLGPPCAFDKCVMVFDI